MSATPAELGLEIGVPSAPASPSAARRCGDRASRRIVPAIAVLLVGAFVLAGAMLGTKPATIRFGAAPAPFVAPLLPAEPVDGALTLVIPSGAAADQQAGGRGYVMPDVIRLRVGDAIVLRNDDDAPHMILYAFLMPGETDERTFAAPGSEVYSSGCGVHAASFLNFTTIFVSERGESEPSRSA